MINKPYKYLYLSVVILLGTLACTPRHGPQGTTPVDIYRSDSVEFTHPKNIILMIGDGMGLTQITAGMYMNGNYTNLERFNFVGLQKTNSSDNLVTDSAAGATSMSAGVKTYNSAIGMNKEGKPVKTILENAEESGFATGIVVTSSIVHATPASFFAHEKYRSFKEAIAADLLDVDVDFIVGGGKKYFDLRKTDERNLVNELRVKGYQVVDYFDKDFNEVKINKNKNFIYFSANDEPLPVLQGRDYFVSACQAATEYLSAQREEQFFLVIEGSQIDWGGHANNSDYIVSEMIEFDRAIGKVLDFAEMDGETLVIVTADHETGGFALNPGSTRDSLIAAFTTDKHTASLVPVFAYGPGAELFTGIYENTAIHSKMMHALKLNHATVRMTSGGSTSSSN